MTWIKIYTNMLNDVCIWTSIHILSYNDAEVCVCMCVCMCIYVCIVSLIEADFQREYAEREVNSPYLILSAESGAVD